MEYLLLDRYKASRMGSVYTVCQKDVLSYSVGRNTAASCYHSVNICVSIMQVHPACQVLKIAFELYLILYFTNLGSIFDSNMKAALAVVR